MEITCQRCGTSRSLPPSRAIVQKFCSISCSNAAGQGQLTHGQTDSRLHSIWTGMKSRCTNPKADKHYFGRVSVCKEWLESFVAFYDWAMANGYADDLQLDRKNTKGNYEPGNCRWATRFQQSCNARKRRGAVTSKFKGVAKHDCGKWVANIQCSRKRFYLGSHTSALKAARAYDAAAVEKFGEFAHLNFPEAFRVAAVQNEVRT